MKIIEWTDRQALQNLKERKIDLRSFVEKVEPIVRDVKEQGDTAIRRYALQFDKRELIEIEIKQRGFEVDPILKKALIQAKENIEKFHAAQMPKEWRIEILPGIEAGQLVRPLKEWDATFQEGDIHLSRRS